MTADEIIDRVTPGQLTAAADAALVEAFAAPGPRADQLLCLAAAARIVATGERRAGRVRLATLVTTMALAYAIGFAAAVVSRALRDDRAAVTRADSIAAACRRHDDSVRASIDGGPICG